MVLKKKDLGDFIEASGLLKYDPNQISQIYRGSPNRLIKRLWETLIPILGFLIEVIYSKFTGKLNDPKQAKSKAKKFADLLVELGPAFIKAGQALSTRPDIVPPVVLEELAQLQDQLPGFDSELAMACIQEDLKGKEKEIFESIEEIPISAASLGQVHKGILKNGQKVAVKVQRPGLREQITLDLYIVRNIGSWLNKNIGLIRSDLVALIDELGKRVFEEMDYLNEASNAEKFRDLHKDNKKIAVPIIYREATSRRVLTMEWINGVKLTNIEAVKKLGIDPEEMVNIGVNCSLQQLLEHGFFHADPHPGNLLALSDGKLCYLDFGMMSEVNRESRTGLIKAVVHLVNRNFEQLSKDFVTLGFLEKDINIKPIIPEFEKVFTSAIELGVDKMDFKSVTDDMSGVMYKLPFRVPPYYALIIRSLITLEGIALSVDPNFKILGASYPYFVKRLMEDPDPKLRESLKEMLFDQDVISWERLQDLISSTDNKSSLDINNIFDQILNYIYSKEGLGLQNKLINSLGNKIDIITWESIQFVNGSLPKQLRSRRIGMKIKPKIKIKSEAIINIQDIIKTIPNFQKEIIKKIPRIITEPDSIKMLLFLAKRITEKGMIRVVKVAAGVAQ